MWRPAGLRPPPPAGRTAWCKWTRLCPVELWGEGLPLHAITSQGGKHRSLFLPWPSVGQEPSSTLGLAIWTVWP